MLRQALLERQLREVNLLTRDPPHIWGPLPGRCRLHRGIPWRLLWAACRWIAERCRSIARIAQSWVGGQGSWALGQRILPGLR